MNASPGGGGPAPALTDGGPEPALRGRRPEPLAITAWALIANTVTTSALGVAFWAVASRLYSPEKLGEDAALISAMILLSTVSQLNLGMGITRLLPQVRDRRWRPVLGAYALTAVVGAILTSGFLVVVSRLSGGFAFLAHEPALGLALLGAVVLWNIFALQDAVLTSARWAAAIPVENGVFGLLKIGVMVGLAGGFIGHGVFLAWLLAMVVLLVPVSGLIFSKVLPSTGGQRSPSLAATVLPLGDRAVVIRYLGTDYLAALLSQGSTALLPLLVVGVLGRAENAYFYVTFLIVSAVGALALSLSTSLVVEGAYDDTNLVSLARRSAVRYVKFIAPAVAALILAAPLVLLPFGTAYVANGTALLRLLLVGTVPQAVVMLYLGVERVRARVHRVLAVEAATLVLVTIGAILGMRRYGLIGLGLAWLIAQVSVAAMVAPRVWRLVGGAGPEREPQDLPLGGFAPVRDFVASRRASGAPVDSLRRPPEPAGAVTTQPMTFPSRVDLIDTGAALVTAVLLVVVGLGITGAGRVALALAFFTFVPGWAVLDYVPLASGTARVALAVALSLSVSVLAAVSVLWLQLWQPRVLFDLAGTICMVAVVWHLAHPETRR